MRSSYKKDDVILLLKDITGLVKPLPTEEREKLIQSGKHYSEMLPIEYVPSPQYMSVYHDVLIKYAHSVASAIGIVSDKIMAKRGKSVVLVSLARAGIPIGILIKKYIAFKYNVDIPHYAISIIRDRGIDDNAMKYLLRNFEPQQLLFVDGWIGKGAICNELKKNVAAYSGVSPEIAVVSDPANITDLCGTHEDILIPSSCLNSTISGLISRTFFREDIIKENDYHGAVYYGELKNSDLSYDFLNAIEKEFVIDHPFKDKKKYIHGSGLEEVKEISAYFGVDNINLIKPGIGETTRVLLRRVPWKVLIDNRYKGDVQLEHIVKLADEKKVPIEYYPLRHYKCCGIIKTLTDI